MDKFRRFANDAEKENFVNAVAELQRDCGLTGRKRMEVGIDSVGVRDAEGEDGVPCVMIRYSPIRMETLPGGQACLQEAVECDIDALRDVLLTEVERSASDWRAMLLRGFDICARTLDRINAPVVLVFGLDGAAQNIDHIILEYSGYKKEYPFSYYGYSEVAVITRWYEFLWSSGALRR